MIMATYAVPDGMDIDQRIWKILKTAYFRRDGELFRSLDFSNFRRIIADTVATGGLANIAGEVTAMLDR